MARVAGRRGGIRHDVLDVEPGRHAQADGGDGADQELREIGHEHDQRVVPADARHGAQQRQRERRFERQALQQRARRCGDEEAVAMEREVGAALVVHAQPVAPLLVAKLGIERDRADHGDLEPALGQRVDQVAVDRAAAAGVRIEVVDDAADPAAHRKRPRARRRGPGMRVVAPGPDIR